MSAVLQKIRRIAEAIYPDWASLAYDPAKPVYSAAGSADSVVSGAIQCLIAGKDREARELLEKADPWLGLVLDRLRRGERFGNLAFEVDAHVNLLLCRWLTESPAGPPDLSHACALLEEYLSGVPADVAQQEWAWTFPILVEGGEAAFCVREFERYHPRFSLATIRRNGEAGMAYLLAKQRLGSVVPAEETRFLARFIPELLESGQYTDCARWVKLLVPPQPGVQPGELLRRTVLRYAG
jgi:hypothetical protein